MSIQFDTREIYRAKRLLEEQIEGYVKTVLGEEGFKELLKRSFSALVGIVDNNINGLIVDKSVDHIGDWTEFYKKCFGLTVDLSNVKIPEYVHRFDSVTIVASELLQVSGGKPYRYILDAMVRNGRPVSIYVDRGVTNPDLDTIVTKNDRWPDESYSVRNRESGEYLNYTTRQVRGDNLQRKYVLGSTLLEHMLYGLKYKQDHDYDCDIGTDTLCSGSRDMFGYLPFVGWYPRKNDDEDHRDYYINSCSDPMPRSVRDIIA